MDTQQNIKLSVDAVVFGYKAKEGLQVLLIKRDIPPFHHFWALPGGLVENTESLEEAVERELHEEAGMRINYLEQLYSFGEVNRDPRNRVVSVAYFGLVKPESFALQAGTDAREAAWFNTKNLPPLAFDHSRILEKALQRLKSKISYEPIGFELLDELFPFSDLEKLYSTLLDRSIDRRNFKKKVLKYGLLEETSHKQNLEGAGRPGNLYRFNEEKYRELQIKGVNFEI
jgi:8-oxo-dGTP diphosphatase